MSKIPPVVNPACGAGRLFCAALAVAFLLGAGCAQPAPSGPAAPDPDAPFFEVEPPPTWGADGLRLATFNGEFLFDGLGDEGAADFAWKGDSAARVHMETVADVIRLLDADVLLIPETEHRGALEALVAGPLAGLGYAPYLVDGQDAFTGQDVGLLSRLPVEAVGRTDERAEVGLTD